MNRFCLVTNKSKDKNFEMTMHIKEYLEQHGKECVIAESSSIKASDDKVSRDFLSEIPADTDC